MSFLQRRIEHFHKLSHRAMGDEITYRPLGVAANDFVLNTINDRRYVQVKDIMSTHPISGAVVSEIEAEIGRDPGKGDQLLINSVIFKVIDFQPDGHDNAILVLERV